MPTDRIFLSEMHKDGEKTSMLTIDKGRKIRTIEGVEVIGRHLRHSVPSEQGVIEVQAALCKG